VTSVPQTQPTAVRRPIPGAAEQARSRELLKTLFASQLMDRSVAGRRKLAQALLAEAPNSADNASDEYVLLGGVIDASKGAGALDLCFQAADLMAGQYEVDGLGIKSDAALNINLRGDSPASAAANVRMVLDLIDPLVEADDFASAQRLLAQARPLAGGDATLTASIQQRLKIVEASRAVYDGVAPDFEKLKTAPDDPHANLAVGSYLCFNKGEWEKGLPMLAKGSDDRIKRVAAMEIARPQSSDETVSVADGWWDIAANQPQASRGAILSHAASLYATVVDGATGLKRALIERRIAEAAAAGVKQTPGIKQMPGRIAPPRELLSLVKTDTDVIGNDCTRDGDAWVISHDTKLIIPTSPQGNYTLTVKAMRKSGENDVKIYFPVGDTIVQLVLSGWYGSASGLQLVDGKGWNENKTSVKPGPLKNGKWYDIAIAVAQHGSDAEVSVKLDGQNYIHWTGPESELSSNAGLPDRLKTDKLIMLGCAHDAVNEFSSVRLTQQPR